MYPARRRFELRKGEIYNLGREHSFPTCSGVYEYLGMYSRVCVTGHLKESVTLIEKSRASCPGGRFLPSFIHQVIIITGLNKLYDYVLALKLALDADRA